MDSPRKNVYNFRTDTEYSEGIQRCNELDYTRHSK